MKDETTLLTSSSPPWWAKHRDNLFIAVFVLLLAMVLGFVPSEITRSLDALMTDHMGMTKTLKVMCVHQAKDDRERKECLD